MKNLFAFDKDENLVNISQVTGNSKGKFTCISCGNELIARKGTINNHHFSHKLTLECNFETYLHKLAKILFFAKYNSCLDKGNPFIIWYEIENVCTSCSNYEHLHPPCTSRKKKPFDLTKLFDKISIEKKHSDFTPDILLESTKSNVVIYLEFAVTHICEQDKLASGIRIIEFNINNEEELKFLHINGDSCTIPPHTCSHNFNVEKERKEYWDNHECMRSFFTFSILKNGKVSLRDMNMSCIIKEIDNSDHEYLKVLGRTNEVEISRKELIDLIQESSKKGLKVLNCYACKYYSKNRSKSSSTIICSRDSNLYVNSSYGYNCDKFWRLD